MILVKGLYKRIISGVLVLVTIFLTCSSVAFASSEGSLQSYQPATFWGWLQSIDNSSWNFWKSLLDKDICPKSPNTNGRHEFVKTHTTVDGKTGYYYICKHCGKSAGEVGNEAYQQQVSDLPASGITSNGSLVWDTYAAFTGTGSYSYVYIGTSDVFASVDSDSLPFLMKDYQSSSAYPPINFRLDTVNHCVIASTAGSGYFSGSGFSFDTEIPVSGSYRRLENPRHSARILMPDGTFLDSSSSFSLSSYSFYTQGQSFHVSSASYFDVPNRAQVSMGSASFYFPVYEVIPDTAIDTTSGGQYSITTRPTVIEGGNYGIIGDDNQIVINNDNRQIIDEENNIYYNPDTGETYNITNWTYDYDNRIYNITLDTGDKVSVEYGDENITITENTINEGDTIVNNYTIYYIIDGSGSGDNPSPAPTACPHEWYKTGERQATCLIPAQRTYTCSICGKQKTETDPVLGHSWHAIKTVTTQYDESGNLTQEGYTIYECERCGEQYKSTNDTGPPPSGGGGSGGSSGGGIFSGIFGVLWDFLSFFFDFFSEFVVGGIKNFIAGLLDAGSDFFAILNPFDWGY